MADMTEDDPALQQSMLEGGGAQRAVVDLLVEQVRALQRLQFLLSYLASGIARGRRTDEYLPQRPARRCASLASVCS